jgi:predicted dehydrogenase
MGKQRIVGISFEHIHMGDLLREAYEHPDAEIVGICDPDRARMADAVNNFAIPHERVFHDIEHCIRTTRPDLAILCPATARHADCAEAVAALGVDRRPRPRPCRRGGTAALDCRRRNGPR